MYTAAELVDFSFFIFWVVSIYVCYLLSLNRVEENKKITKSFDEWLKEEQK